MALTYYIQVLQKSTQIQAVQGDFNLDLTAGKQRDKEDFSLDSNAWGSGRLGKLPSSVDVTWNVGIVC